MKNLNHRTLFTVPWVRTKICTLVSLTLGIPRGSAVKNLPVMQNTQETWIGPQDWEDPPEEGMATHSRILAWRIPWTEEPGRLQSMGSQRVRHDWATEHTCTQSHFKTQACLTDHVASPWVAQITCCEASEKSPEREISAVKEFLLHVAFEQGPKGKNRIWTS